jgi:hypothetical protein
MLGRCAHFSVRPSQNFRIGRGLTSARANHQTPSPCALFVLGGCQTRLISETSTPPDTLGTIALGVRHLHGIHFVPAMRPRLSAAFCGLVADDPAFPFVDSVLVEPLDCIKQL